MHRRPTGVTLSAVVLGVFDLFLLLTGLFYTTLTVLFARSSGVLPAVPGKPTPPEHLLPIICGLLALMTLVCAIWGISTFFGLLRMRRWARISIMVIGGCLAAFSLLELFGSIIVQISMKNFVLPPNAGSGNLVPPNPEAMQGAFYFVEGICVIIAAIGLWWLVYFALQRTREAFELVSLQTGLNSTTQLNPAALFTDFSVAHPLDPSQLAPAQPAPEISGDQLPATQAAPAANARPVSMTIVAVLLFLGALSMLVCCVFLLEFPVPLFFFGVKISGASSGVLTISMAALYAVAGYGLLRRMPIGWLLAVGVYILGLLNLLTMLSPPIRIRWLSYMREIAASTQTIMPAVAGNATAPMQMFQQKLMAELMVPSLLLGIVFMLFILVLLWRARWAYKTVSAE
jgi:hypothetical protein